MMERRLKYLPRLAFLIKRRKTQGARIPKSVLPFQGHDRRPAVVWNTIKG